MPHDLEALRQSLADLGTTKIAHLDGDLRAHMTNVYLLLERLERPEYVRLAGLFHGIYGTHALHGMDVFTLSDERRVEIRRLIGDRAEQLVYLFCVMAYDSLGKSFRNILRPGGVPRLRNRCTNEPLDITKDDFLELLWLKLADVIAHIQRMSHDARRTVAADFGPFWHLVAEFLGPRAVAVWTDYAIAPAQ